MVVVDVVDRSVGSGVAAGSGYHTPVASGVWSAGVAAVWGDGHRLRACKISFFFFPECPKCTQQRVLSCVWQKTHNKELFATLALSCALCHVWHTTKSYLCVF